MCTHSHRPVFFFLRIQDKQYGALLAQCEHKMTHALLLGFYSIFLSISLALWLIHFKLELIGPINVTPMVEQ